MKVLVIGGTGHMGTAIRQFCRENRIDYEAPSQTELDITHYGVVNRYLESCDCDVVMNMAVVQGIDPCELNPDLAFAVNMVAVSNLARTCERLGKTFLHGSTHSVFDGRKPEPYVESDPAHPLGSVYAVSKWAAGCLVQSSCSRHYIARFPVLFGPTGTPYKGFIGKMLDRMRRGEELRVADDKIDSYCYTMDAVRALFVVLAMPYGVYHITNSGYASYYDVIDRIVRQVNSGVRLWRAKDDDFPSHGPKPLRGYVASEKLSPLRPWQDALAEYVGGLDGLS